MKNKMLLDLKKISKSCDRLSAARLLFVAALLFTSHIPAAAQSLSSFLGNKNPSASPPHNQPDPLNRTTPRAAIFNFLEACHADRYVLAARYLDLRRIPAADRQTEGPDLARQLADLLDKEPRFEVDQLSDDPAGNVNDGLAPDLEVLVKLNTNEEPSALFLQRVSQQGIEVWLVASDSVPHIAEMDALEGASDIEKHMPRFLVTHKLLGTSWWAWISLIILTFLLLVLSRLLSRLFLAVFTPVIKRFAESLQTYRLETLTNPLRLLISLALFRAVMEVVTPSALLRDYLIRLLVLLSTIGLAALAMRIVDLASTQFLGRLDPSERALSYSVMPLGVRVIRIGIFLIAALLILASWGYNTNAILAGLGVGGLAVALAAQKTIENLFGAVALVSDRPVLVGDFCQFGTQTGTVEDIGLRSTRIRTNDRTTVTIPNSNFSTMTIENFSRRDRMWFHPTLKLRRDTNPGKVRELMDAIAQVLHSDPLVETPDVPVRFTRITDYSLDLEVFAYITTSHYQKFLEAQSALLLQLLESVERHGVRLALPIAESVTVNPPDLSPSANSSSHPAAEPPAAPPPPG